MCILTNLQFRCFVQAQEWEMETVRERKSLTTSPVNAAAFYQLQNENSFIAAFWSIDVKIVWSFSFQHFFVLSSRLPSSSPFIVVPARLCRASSHLRSTERFRCKCIFPSFLPENWNKIHEEPTGFGANGKITERRKNLVERSEGVKRV